MKTKVEQITDTKFRLLEVELDEENLMEFGTGPERCTKDATWRVEEPGHQCVGFVSEKQARSYAYSRKIPDDYVLEGPCDDC